MSSPFHAVVIGESIIDCVNGSRIRGGSPANVAVGLARLGRQVALASSWSRDEDGRFLTQSLTSEGVYCVPGCDKSERTSIATVNINEDGAPAYEFSLQWDIAAMARDAVDDVLESHDLLIHTGSLGPLMQPGASRVHALVEKACVDHIVTYDPNIRPALCDENTQEFVEVTRDCADVVKCSDEDLAWLYGIDTQQAHDMSDDDCLDALAQWRGTTSGLTTVRGGMSGLVGAGTAIPSLMICTRGAHGCVMMTRRGHTARFSAPHVDKVADTVGAGDSFMSGLIDAMIARDLHYVTARDSMSGADAQMWAPLVRHAMRCAAVTVSRLGAQPPTHADLV